MLKILRAEGIVAGRLVRGRQSQEDIDAQVNKFQNYLTRKEPSMRVTKKALTTVATWADMHIKPILLGDIPW